MGLSQILAKLYPDSSDKLLQECKHLFSTEKVIPPFQREKDWYKTQQLYVVYPDSFQVKDEANLHTLTQNLDYIAKLGCTGVHILPFFESPLIDRGYDVSNYEAVRPNLGGNEALEKFLAEAHTRNLSVFIDIILNHTSNKHPWFLMATQGDEFFRKFYISQRSKPQLLALEEDEFGLWASYQLETSTIRTRVIFPDKNRELPHWFQGEDGYWYYHTFYPEQPDLNWNNSEVFLTMAEIIVYWAQKGVNFRLDAIPFLGKQLEKGSIESGERTHQIIQALHTILHFVAPHSVFLVEACQPQKTTIEYFGKESAQAEYAYSFRLMQGLWAGLLGKNQQLIWDSLEGMNAIPEWGQWITFLRNHDELTLEFADEHIRQLIYSALQKKGLPFREGFGVAGRTATFLQDPQRVQLAYMLLASLPGVPAIVYGDEIGKHNDLDYMEKQTALRKLITGKADLLADMRDANRGTITQTERDTLRSLQLYSAFSRIFRTRRRFSTLSTQYPEPLPNTPKDIFAASYQLPEGKLLIYINLGEESYRTKVPLNSTVELTLHDADKETDDLLLPACSGIWLRAPNEAPQCLLE
jgi:maltose alpha-D-glucosyltransferase/alpha-amylase